MGGSPLVKETLQLQERREKIPRIGDKRQQCEQVECSHVQYIQKCLSSWAVDQEISGLMRFDEVSPLVVLGKLLPASPSCTELYSAPWAISPHHLHLNHAIWEQNRCMSRPEDRHSSTLACSFARAPPPTNSAHCRHNSEPHGCSASAAAFGENIIQHKLSRVVTRAILR